MPMDEAEVRYLIVVCALQMRLTSKVECRFGSYNGRLMVCG
jgi:hypothetical protein